MHGRHGHAVVESRGENWGFSCKFFRKNFLVLTTNLAAFSRCYKSRTLYSKVTIL